MGCFVFLLELKTKSLVGKIVFALFIGWYYFNIAYVYMFSWKVAIAFIESLSATASSQSKLTSLNLTKWM